MEVKYEPYNEMSGKNNLVVNNISVKYRVGGKREAVLWLEAG